MKQTLGKAMLAAPFVAIFILAGSHVGYGAILLVMLGVVALYAWIGFAVRLMDGEA